MVSALPALFLPVVIAVAVACGGAASSRPEPASAPPTEVSANPPPAAPAPSPASAPLTVPSACADPSAPVCAPPGEFVERLCAKPHQDLALSLFGKDTPFTRLYLRGKMDELVLDEEVLALRFRAPQKGGMVVGSGNGSYDVLRWDGTCSTGVEAEMVSRSRPPQPRTAKVRWHRIDSRTQDTLVASSEPVKRAHARRGKECKGAMTGDVSASCESADQALVTAIIDYVRSHAALSPPPPDPTP
jgi:hypothetical protein